MTAIKIRGLVNRLLVETKEMMMSEEMTSDAYAPRLVDPKLLEILVCPLCKGPLVYDAQAQELISEKSGLAYPIRDGIPIMLVDEARRLEDGYGQ